MEDKLVGDINASHQIPPEDPKPRKPNFFLQKFTLFRQMLPFWQFQPKNIFINKLSISTTIIFVMILILQAYYVLSKVG